MLKLSAFADEISPKIGEQVSVCRENGVSHIELRGAEGKNVLDFDTALAAEIRSKIKDGGMGVSAIGSPIGKIKIHEPFEPHFERFKKAVEWAQFFEAPFIRIFSFYPSTEGELLYGKRDEVLRRLRLFTEYVKDLPVVLLHENEGRIYGEMGKECLDLMASIPSPKFRNCFDFANFVQAGQNPAKCWPQLKPYTDHIHIKDALFDSGKVVPAGQGDGQIRKILADAWKSGYRGFLTLEPHLAHAGQFQGFSGPQLFKVAVDALKKVCADESIPLTPFP